jgi:hypothetical protein
MGSEQKKDTNMKSMKLHKSKLAIILLGVGLIGSFFYFSFFSTFYRSKQITNLLIIDNVERLAGIFKEINDTCGIIDFDLKKNPINFLNVEKFAGSEVGPMNLAHPEKWRGPYVPHNPTINDKEFQVVRTNKGYFVTPGDGVTLPNGKVIGKEVIIDENSDIPAMMRNENELLFEDKPLAAPIATMNKHTEPASLVVIPDLEA